MAQHACDRCKDEVKTYIPTHQFVKFDDRHYYLCDICWDHFRAWFHGQIHSKQAANAA